MTWGFNLQTLAFVVSQLCATTSLVFLLRGYLMPTVRKTHLNFVANAGLMGLHQLLLGAWPGAMTACFGMTRYGVGLYAKDEERPWPLGWKLAVAGLINALQLAGGVWLYRGPVDLLALVAGFVATIIAFFLVGLPFRAALVFTTLLWLAYNYLDGSPMGTLFEALALGFAGWGTWQEYRAQRLRRQTNYPAMPQES